MTRKHLTRSVMRACHKKRLGSREKARALTQVALHTVRVSQASLDSAVALQIALLSKVDDAGVVFRAAIAAAYVSKAALGAAMDSPAALSAAIASHVTLDAATETQAAIFSQAQEAAVISEAALETSRASLAALDEAILSEEAMVVLDAARDASLELHIV